MSWRTLVLYQCLWVMVLVAGACGPTVAPLVPQSPLVPLSPLSPLVATHVPMRTPTLIPTPTLTPALAFTPTPTPTSTSAPTLLPGEAPAQAIADVVGSWIVGGKGGVLLTLWPDGSFSSGFPYFLRSYFDSGMFAVADGQLQWLTSQACAGYGQATYAVFVIKEDGRPVRLRFEPVGEDPCWLREMLLVMEPVTPGPR